VPSCAEGGVLGILPAIIGSLQANEVVKLILEVGEPLIGRLVLFDALQVRLREVKLEKSPECPVCSENPTLTELIDYERFCGLAPESPQTDTVNVTPEKLESWLQEGRELQLLDVRTLAEHQTCRLDDSLLIPVQVLPRRFEELDRDAEIVVYCHHGHRSAHAVDFLRRMGFVNTFNLAGGIDAWSKRVDPSVPLY
jgi:adenylyltransferase/sulfurtransferase